MKWSVGLKFLCTCTCYSTTLPFPSSDDSYFLLLQQSSVPPSLISSSRFFTILPEPSPDSALFDLTTPSVSLPPPSLQNPILNYVILFTRLPPTCVLIFCSASPSYRLFYLAYWSLVSTFQGLLTRFHTCFFCLLEFKTDHFMEVINKWLMVTDLLSQVFLTGQALFDLAWIWTQKRRIEKRLHHYCHLCTTTRTQQSLWPCHPVNQLLAWYFVSQQPRSHHAYGYK